jgi:creatinine amidohydrolase
MRWTEVRPALEAGAVAVLPVGAAAKEHGPHLPLATDYLTAEALGRLLAERAEVLVWPTVGYGFYPAFVDYPGSTSLDAATFEATVAQLLADLIRAGASRALVLDTGVSTIAPIDRAVARAVGARVAACHVYRGEKLAAAHDALIEQERGSHADEAETSVMLHLHPELVDLDAAVAWTRPIAPGRWSPDDPRHPSHSPSGVYGDPTRATASKGRRLVEAMIEDLLDSLDALGASGPRRSDEER